MSVQPKTTSDVKQSPTSTSYASPKALETITLLRHISDPSKATPISAKTPCPEGIDPPVREKPSTVSGLFDKVNPFSAARPPEALIILAPVKLN